MVEGYRESDPFTTWQPGNRCGKFSLSLFLFHLSTPAHGVLPPAHTQDAPSVSTSLGMPSQNTTRGELHSILHQADHQHYTVTHFTDKLRYFRTDLNSPEFPRTNETNV